MTKQCGCYQFVSTFRTWNNAAAFCISLQGGHLVSIHDDNTNNYLGSILAQSWPSWIGLQRVGDKFEWIDGTPLNFTAWGKGQPDGSGNGVYINYNVVGTDGQWDDLHKSVQGPSICETDPIPTLSGKRQI